MSSDGSGVNDAWDEAMVERERDADGLYAALTPAGAGEDEARVLRQALSGMLWTKQFFHFDVDRWLEGDPALPRHRRVARAVATTSGATSTTPT